MLTHVHLLVYTLWCWDTLRRRWSLKGRERMGSSLPPADLARQDSALFKKMKFIFSIAPVGNLEKSRESHRTLARRHRTQCLHVRCAICFKAVRVRHRTQVKPCWRVRCCLTSAGVSD